MAEHVERATLRDRLLTLIAIVLLVVSSVAILGGGVLTLFAFSPANISDAGQTIRGGPTMLLGGVFGLAKARRLWRCRGPNPCQPRPLVLLVEVPLFGALLAFAFLFTQFLLDASPWSTTPKTFYNSAHVAHVVPLAFSTRMAVGLVAIRLVPIMASVASARSLVLRARTAAISAIAVLPLAALAYLDARQFPAAPYVFALFVLDLALVVALGTAAIEVLGVRSESAPS